MRKLTLRDIAAVTINDLFMAVIETDVSVVQARKKITSLIPGDGNYEKFERFIQNIEYQIRRIRRVNSIRSTSSLEEVEPIRLKRSDIVIILKYGDKYFDLSENGNGEEVNTKIKMIQHLEPFSDYYSEGEYFIFEENGSIHVDVNSEEPYKRYCDKVCPK